jgi:RES domain
VAAPRVDLDDLELVAAPAAGYDRVSKNPEPFSPPSAPLPLKWSDTPVLGGNRWDDPRGVFLTLYCSTSEEGAFGETIAPFRKVPGLRARIDAFLTGAPDPAFSPPLTVGAVPADYFDGRYIGHAWSEPAALFVDVDNSTTHVALSILLDRILAALGYQMLDRGLLLGPDRRITRIVAAVCHELANRPPTACGLRYESRLRGEWECWALWEPFPFLPLPAEVRPVRKDDPALRSAARKLGIKLPS